MDERSSRALVDLGRALVEEGYAFTTVTPETHRRVNARAAARGAAIGKDLRDVFGWSRPVARALLPRRIGELAEAAGILAAEGDLVRSRVRFSSLRGRLFVHSAYPTLAPDSVFFGPDTVRFCDFVAGELEGRSFERAVDVGSGSGAGGILAACAASRVVLADVNRAALAFAEVNARISGVEERVEIVESDVLGGVPGAIDLVIANPPYMLDPAERAYRSGGGAFGEHLAVRIAREALSRLAPGGRLLLYTGAAVAEGIDTFLESVRGVCDGAGATWRYHELDPDVFGEEIEQNDAYARVERIAAVALVAQA